MTRETKVGLAVAMSFLCLVGVVVAARLSLPEEGQKNSPPAIAQAKQPGAKSAGQEPVSSSAPKNTEPPVDAAAKAKVVPANLSEPNPLPNMNTTGPIAAAPDLNTKGNSSIAAPPEPPNMPPQVADNKPPAAPEISEEEQKKIKQALTEQLKISTPAAFPGKPETPEPAAVVAKNDGFPVPPPVPDVKKTDPAPAPNSLANTPPTNTKPPEPDAPMFSVRPAPKPDNASVIVPPSPPPPDAPTIAAPKQTDPPIPVASITAPAPLVDKNDPPPPKNPFPSTPAPSAPVIGSNPPATSPPIPVGLGPDSKKSVPQVKSYDVETYFTKADDRSFSDISKKLYGSERYGNALLQFNRNHPLAPDSIKQDPPLLRAGQAIYSPPLYVLESNFPAAVANTGQPASNSNSPPVTFGQPKPLVTTTPGNPSAVNAPPPGTQVQGGIWTGPDNSKNYRVPDGGQHILEIARATLGDGQRWPQIYQLNPSLRPEFPIPAGTVVKLPPTANIP